MKLCTDISGGVHDLETITNGDKAMRLCKHCPYGLALAHTGAGDEWREMKIAPPQAQPASSADVDRLAASGVHDSAALNLLRSTPGRASETK